MVYSINCPIYRGRVYSNPILGRGVVHICPCHCHPVSGVSQQCRVEMERDIIVCQNRNKKTIITLHIHHNFVNPGKRCKYTYIYLDINITSRQVMVFQMLSYSFSAVHVLVVATFAAKQSSLMTALLCFVSSWIANTTA